MRLLSALTALLWGMATMAGPEPPHIEHVGMVAPDIIGITILAGRVEYGRQVPYVKEPGDFVAASEVHRFVARGGKIIGSLVGRDGDILCTMDEVIGERLDTAWADRPASYEVASEDDPDYGTPRKPAAVYRKSKPSDLGMIGPYKFDSPTENVIYLKLPAPLGVGKSYVISFRDSKLSAHAFAFDPSRLRSEAVHVSQIGFRPDDPAKDAFLSCWLGNTYEVSKVDCDVNFGISVGQPAFYQGCSEEYTSLEYLIFLVLNLVL